MTVLGVDRAALHAAWDEIADSGFYTEGKYTRLFEEAVEEWSGMHAVAVNSCGSGLFALYRQFAPGRALVPANTFFATGAMAREAGHGIKLADCGENDFSMGLEQLCQAITPEISLVVLTHVGGWLAKDYEQIASYCAHAGVPLIEDAAHVFGVRTKEGTTAGRLGCAAVFSLYPTKAVPVGEGGVIVTADSSLAQQLREFRNYGKWKRQDGAIMYNHGRASGFNLRMDEWTAAVAYLQTKRIPDIMEKRAEAAHRLAHICAPHPAVPLYFDGSSNWYKYPVEASFPAKRTTGKIYQLTDQLPEALGLTGDFPNAEKIARTHICLPLDEGLYAEMGTQQIVDYLTKE